MRHFVQHHNPDKMGHYRRQQGKYGIVTDKAVLNTLDQRIWLISRSDSPRHYVLCETFIVDEVGPQPSGPFKNFANGSHGSAPHRPISIEQEAWFERLRYLTGNFGFGLQTINDPNVINGLLSLIKP